VRVIALHLDPVALSSYGVRRVATFSANKRQDQYL
jgi:hypothetical protein